MIARGDVVDVLMGDDEALVLTSRQCLRLGVLAASILDSLEVPRARADLERHLEELFGPAPPGRLDEVLDELRGQGVIDVSA